MTDWQTIQLGDVTTKVGSGSTPRGGETAYKPSGIPLIRSMNVHFDGFRRDGLAYLDDEQAAALRNVEVQAGDVLLNITGASIGRVTVAPSNLHGARVNQHVCIIRPDSRLDPSFLRWHLASPHQQRLINSVESGATRQALTKEKILSFEIPLPPLAEQQLAVAEIEKQFSRLDEAVAGLKRVKANLKRYKAAILKAAVEGRLVPTEADLARCEGRSYETGNQLLQRILETRRSQWQGKGKYKEPAAPNTSDLSKLPEGWVWASIDQILFSLRNGLSGKPEASEPGIPILRISAVRPLVLDIADHRYYRATASESPGDYRIQQGDLLFVRYNGTKELVGACACVGPIDHPLLYPDKLIRGRVVSESLVLADYVAIAANVGESRRHVDDLIKTTAGQQGITGGEVKQMPLPLPPAAEQHRIVAEVDRLLSIAREAETEVDANLKRAQALRQSVLTKLFSMELT